MDIIIAGGHGKIALLLTRLLNERGDRVRSLIRNPAHAGDVEAAGGEPVVCDIEQVDENAVASATAGADAVVFAAGPARERPGAQVDGRLRRCGEADRRRAGERDIAT